MLAPRACPTAPQALNKSPGSAATSRHSAFSSGSSHRRRNPKPRHLATDFAMNPPIPPLATNEGRAALLATYRAGLLDDTLRFWFPRSVDPEHGGFLHCFDRDGTLVDTDKGVWIQGRMSWMLLTLF